MEENKMQNDAKECLTEQNTSPSCNSSPNADSITPCRYVIDRPTYTQAQFSKLCPDEEDEKEPLAKRALVKMTRCCTLSLPGKIFLSLFPFFSWIRKYKVSEWLPGDLVAGITIGIVHIPQSIAFAILTGLPPVFGLYSSFYPVLIYTLMGTSRHISVGTFAIPSLLTQSVVLRLSESEDTFALNTSLDANATTTAAPGDGFGLTAFEERRVLIASTVMFLMGIFQLTFGILRLGFVTTYMSEPLIQAFTIGAAIVVVTTQTPAMLGLPIQSTAGIGSLPLNWVNIFRNFPNINVATLIISIITVTILVIGREINERYKEKLKFPIPTEIIVVALGAISSHFGRFEATFSVVIVGNIPKGFLAPRPIDTSILHDMVGDAFALAMVGFVLSMPVAKLYAQKYRCTIDSNQEFIAYGVSNFVPSFFSCFPTCAALARCAIQDNCGGKTQIVGLISSLVVLFTILFLGPIFKPLPRGVLACIIVCGLFGILKQVTSFKLLYRISKFDLVIWLFTLAAVLFLGVDIGLFASMGFAILLFVFRTQLPRRELIDKVPGTDIYRKKNRSDTVNKARTRLAILKSSEV